MCAWERDIKPKEPRVRLTAPPLLLFPVLLHSSSPLLLFFSPLSLCHLTVNCTTGKFPPGVTIKLLLFTVKCSCIQLHKTCAYVYTSNHACKTHFWRFRPIGASDLKRSKPGCVWMSTFYEKINQKMLCLFFFFFFSFRQLLSLSETFYSLRNKKHLILETWMRELEFSRLRIDLFSNSWSQTGM